LYPVGPASVAETGSVDKCRELCSSIDLDRFFTALQNNYIQYFNEQTESLCEFCKQEELKYGSARKVLNIFFRNIVTANLFKEVFKRSRVKFKYINL